MLPAVSKNFPHRPRITGSLRQGKLDGTDILMFPFLGECWGLPTVTGSGEIVTEKWLPSKHFQAVCYSQQTECWETYASPLNEWQQEECFSGIYLSATVQSLRCENPTFPQRPRFPESQPECFCAPFEPCEQITTSYWKYSWGERLQECVWLSWVPYCFYLV